MTNPAVLVKKLLQPKMLLLGAVLIGILYIGGFLTLFPGLSGVNERTMTLSDGKNIQVFDNGLSVAAGSGAVTATSTSTSDKRADQSNIVLIQLLPSLDKVEKVGIRGAATVTAGTPNFPSNAALWVAIEEVASKNNVLLLKRMGSHDGLKVSPFLGGDVPGGVKDAFSEGLGSGTTGTFGNVEFIIPESYRTSQYRLIVDIHVSAKSYSTGKVTYKFDGIDITKTGGLILDPPNVPPAPSLQALISVIKDWIKRLLDAVPFLNIAGAQSPVLGSTQTYQVALAAPYALDTTFADGTYAVRYCNTALVKADGTILTETGFETCTDSYSKSFTVKLPSQAGQYAVIAVMAESKGTYGTETGQWTFAPYEIISKDALDITTKAPIPGAGDIPIKPSINFLTNLLKSLFGWLPFFK